MAIVLLKHKFMQASGAPYASFLVKAVNAANGLAAANSPARLYNSAGQLMDSDGTMQTSASGDVSGYFDDGKPVAFVLYDAAGSEIERSNPTSSGANFPSDLNKPELLALTAAQSYQLDGSRKRFVHTGGTIASATISLPATPEDGQEQYISARGTITALTVQVASGSGHTLNTPVTAAALNAGSSVGWVYNAVDTTWTRIQ